MLSSLEAAQAGAPNGDGKGLVATCHDTVSTGIEGFSFFNRLHISATAWFILAELHYNPYWGIGTDAPVPHQGD